MVFRKGNDMAGSDKEQKIRMIAFDLDGTALHRKKGLTEGTRQTLLEAARLGVTMVTASGRPWSALPKELTAMDGLEYFIVGNGSSILRRQRGSGETERIYGKYMEPDKVEEALFVAADYPWPLEVTIGGTAYARADYVERPTDFGASSNVYVQTTRLPVKDIEAFIRRNISRIEGLTLIVADMEEKAAIRERLEKIPHIHVTSSVPRYLEMMNGSVNKAEALAFLADRLKIGRKQIAAFGDGENDKEMLVYAGIGVAMENGAADLKAAADRIAPDCDQDGMARVIRQMLSLPEKG